MKKIGILTCSILLLFGSFLAAQTTNGRSVQTILADVLAQMPADKQAGYDKLIKELCLTGEEGVLMLVGQMHTPGRSSNARVEYALNGMSHYVTGTDGTTFRNTLEKAYLKAFEQTNEREVKAFIIRQLAICGSDQSIDKMATLLAHETLSGPAARTIASIGTETAGKALMAALSRRMGTPKTQQNVILALAEMPVSIADSEVLLNEFLNQGDADMQKVVLYALGKTGTKSSLATLAKEAGKTGFTLENTGANDAYLLLIDRVFEQGDIKEATAAATDLLKKATKAGQTGTRIAALQLIMKNQHRQPAQKTLMDALKDPSMEYRNAALNAASAFADKDLYAHLIRSVGKMKTGQQVDVINWIAREAKCPQKREVLNTTEVGAGKTGIQTFIDQLGTTNNYSVKRAIANVLVNMQNQQSVVPLAKLLSDSDDAVVTLGKTSLEMFHGDIAAAVVKQMPVAGDPGKIAALELLALRRSSGYLNTVLEQTTSNSENVRKTAYSVLKYVVEEKDQDLLCGMLEAATPEVIAPVQDALIAVMATYPASKRVELMTHRMQQAGEQKRYLYYLPLATTGSPKALAEISKGYATGRDASKEAAFAALLSWKGPEVMTDLYAIAKDPTSGSHAEKALSGYIKLASNAALTAENRFLYLRNAMDIAQTDAQKKSILTQISRTGTFPALVYAGNFINTPALKENAALAVMNIALNNKSYTGALVEALLEKASVALNNPDADYQRQSIRKHLDEMPKEEGFVSLFNGKDLTGWKGLVQNPVVRAKMTPAQLAKEQAKADEQMRKDWKVENGLLVFDGKGYDNLCTEKQYGDIEMYVDWKLDPAGPEADAGIYLRGTPQVQIWDTARVNVGAQVGSGGLYNNQIHESKPLKVADNRLGEWNTLYIKMTGDRVTVKLNGELVTNDVILENYWDRKQPLFPMEQIELQAHGSKVYYRDIYVREVERPEPFRLSAEEEKEGFYVLFDGTNMHEWIGNLVDYSIEDGCISLTPSKNYGGNLYTKKEYDDFVFRFEFQLTPAANNGLGIRTPIEGDAAYSGMELQILDSEHPVYANLKAYQYHGSVYGVIPAKRGYLKPTGEWNYQEVIAKGNRIKVILNGTVILDGDLKEATENGTNDGKAHPGLFNKKGHIGFLGHGSPLKFRNIRVKELK